MFLDYLLTTRQIYQFVKITVGCYATPGYIFFVLQSRCKLMSQRSLSISANGRSHSSQNLAIPGTCIASAIPEVGGDCRERLTARGTAFEAPGQRDMDGLLELSGEFAVISDKSILGCHDSSHQGCRDTSSGTRRDGERNHLQFVNAAVQMTWAGTTCLNRQRSPRHCLYRYQKRGNPVCVKHRD